MTNLSRVKRGVSAARPCLRRSPTPAPISTGRPFAVRRQLRRHDSPKTLGPTRRLELPSRGLRNRHTTVVLRGLDLARRIRCEPGGANNGSARGGAGDRSRTDLGWCGAPTCHQDSPAWRCDALTYFANRRGRIAATSGDSLVGWVGFEPTCVRGKSPLQSDFATSPMIVPPSGIEPEPLGLQPSAQTTCARVGYERDGFGVHHADHRHRLRLSEIAHDAQGAPRAAMHPLCTRAHYSRFEICCFRSRVAKPKLCMSVARNVEGPPGFPWRPFRHVDV